MAFPSTSSHGEPLRIMRLQIRLAAAILLILTAVNPIRSEDGRVPFDLQAKLLLKILTFDRNLETRVDSAVVVGIVYQPGYRQSERARSELSAALDKYSDKKVKGLPVSVVTIRYLSRLDLMAKVRSENVSVLYVTSCDSAHLEEIIKVARENHILTISSEKSHVEEGISLAVGLKENKPQITINLSSAKAEGCEFSSQLLKLAEVLE